MLLKHALRGVALSLGLALAAVATPAAADCLKDIAALEQRVIKIETDTRNAPDSPRAQEPQAENWFGAPSSIEGMRDQLHNARTLAEDGNEAGCHSHLDQVRATVEALSR